MMSLIAVICELKSNKSGVKKITPIGKTIFRPGDKVEITCSRKFWGIVPYKTKKEFICQHRGKWDYEPVCEGKIMEKHFWIL